MQELNLNTVEYEEFIIENGELTTEAKKRYQQLLEIQRDGNVIYICHPRHILEQGTYITDGKTKDIVEVDWDKINFEQMKSYNDYGKFSIVEQICQRRKNQFTHVQKKANHMLKKYKQLDITEFSYPLVITEEIMDLRGPGSTLLVRGIISFNQNGLKIAFNPEFEKTLSTEKESIWSKALKFSDN